MADEPISGLPAATVPLSGTELLPIDQGGTTKKVSAQDIVNLNGFNAQTNGVASTANNSVALSNIYTVSASDIVSGSNFVYYIDFKAINLSASVITGFYQMQYLVGSTFYNFDLENIIIAQNSTNTAGFIEAKFRVYELSSVGYIASNYNISLYDPNNGAVITYENAAFQNQTFQIGTDDLTVQSFIESDSTDLTIQLLGSTFENIKGA